MIKERTLTVAVLPFVNVTANPRVDDIGKAIANALRDDLRSAEMLTVRHDANNTTGDHDIYVGELGRTMHADALLLGCVCESDGVLHAKVQIVESRTGRTRWATHDEMPVGEATADALAGRMASNLERAINLGF